MAGNTIQITPFMHTADVPAATRFFVETLGFTAVITGDRYAYVEREGAAIRIQWHDDATELGTPHRGFAYYIDVHDLAIVEAQLRPRLANLPAGHVVGPIDQRYGQRELVIRAPDGNLVVFGRQV